MPPKLIRSVKVYYPRLPSYVSNEDINWYWSSTADDTSNQIHTSPRNAADAAIFSDYELLPKYQDGQYLVIVKSTGKLVLAEVTMTFAEMRKRLLIYLTAI